MIFQPNDLHFVCYDFWSWWSVSKVLTCLPVVANPHSVHQIEADAIQTTATVNQWFNHSKNISTKNFFFPVSAEYIQLIKFWCISSYGTFELWLNNPIKCDCTQHRSCIKPPNTNTLFAQTLTLTFLLTHRVGLNVFTEESQSHDHIFIINSYAFAEPLSIQLLSCDATDRSLLRVV